MKKYCVQERTPSRHRQVDIEASTSTQARRKAAKDYGFDYEASTAKEVKPPQALIDRLNKRFPGINAVCSSEFDGRMGGIWFRQEGAAHKDGFAYFDYWSTMQMVHPKVEKVLDSAGFYAEPYDAGTWFAYKA